jgi:hypothetical protein
MTVVDEKRALRERLRLLDVPPVEMSVELQWVLRG